MKTFKYYLAYLAIFSLMLSSCSKDESTSADDPTNDNVAVISFGPVLNSMLKQATTKQESDIPECSTADPAYAQISLTYGDSNTPVNVVADVMSDEGGLFTAYNEDLEIPIPAGETSVSVTLTDFVVWDDVDGAPGNVIWVAPKEGSEYAHFVDDPLDMTFDLRAGTKKYVDVPVLCFDNRDVNLYGYQFFDISPEVVYELCFFSNFCTDSGRHYTANYSLNLWLGTSSDGTPLYTDKMPVTGEDGSYYAEPICLAIPGPQNGEGPDDPYLYYEASLESWPGNYGDAGNYMASGTLSWSQVEALLNDDGESVDYFHIFINCDGGGNGTECDPNDATADCDNDGVPNGEDVCPGYDDTADMDMDGIPDGCDDDIDGDGVLNGEDQCPGFDDTADMDMDGIPDACDACPEDPTNSCGMAATCDQTLPAPDNGCDTVYLEGSNGGADFVEISSVPALKAFTGFNGAITIDLDNGHPVIIISNADTNDYLVEVSQTMGGDVVCQLGENIDPPASPEDPDALIVFDGVTYTAPFYVKISANVCQQ